MRAVYYVLLSCGCRIEHIEVAKIFEPGWTLGEGWTCSDHGEVRLVRFGGRSR